MLGRNANQTKCSACNEPGPREPGSRKLAWLPTEENQSHSKPIGRGTRVAEALLFICVFCRADLEHRNRTACAPVPRTMGACMHVAPNRREFSPSRRSRIQGRPCQNLPQASEGTGSRRSQCGARDCLYTLQDSV
jgi:hypothetical protein